MKVDFEVLDKILSNHQKFLAGDPDGEKANLKNAELFGTNLIGVNLKDAKFF